MLETPALAAIRSWVRERLGIYYDDERRVLLERRLIKEFGDEPAQLAALYARLLKGDTTSVARVAELASTNYTYFFREPESFAYLAKYVAPQFPREGTLRVWSAAASSGEEAYSVALALVGALGPDVLARLQLLGTDISERQLRSAERAEYEPAQLRLVPDALRHHFEPAGEDGRSKLRHGIARVCTFRRLNLTSTPWPFAQKFQLILLRNVLYYFDAPTRAAIVNACHDAALPGAHLWLGLGESLIDVTSPWRSTAPGFYVRGEGP